MVEVVVNPGVMWVVVVCKFAVLDQWLNSMCSEPLAERHTVVTLVRSQAPKVVDVLS